MKSVLLLVALVAQIATAAEVDLKSSYVQWTGSKVTGDKHTGKIKFKEAVLNLKGDAVQDGKFIVDFGTLTVEDIKDADKAAKLVGHLTNGDFFDTGKFPTAQYVIDSAKANEAVGSLKIKDKENKITVPFKKNGNVYTGTFTFDRTKYGVVYGSSNFFKELVAEKIIKDEVQLEFNVVLK